MKIAKIKGREILDSRGNPTVEVDVTLESGIMHLFRRVHPPVNMKLWNYATETRPVMEEKEF